jgi:4-hydroxy-2-oxoheptanedioate aldolase
MTMEAPVNKFKQRLAQKLPLIGLWAGLSSAYTTEVCAGAGFDWLLIDAEHAPNDLPSILAQLQVLAGYATLPVVRPPIGETWLIKQLLDIGAQTLLIPMVETSEQATQLVAATRYPPHGIRGVGSALARASHFNRRSAYLGSADAQICLLVQLESVAGLDNLETIAAVDGVDGLFIGPADLAAALGHLGDPGHPEVQAAIDNAIRRINATGKASGILTSDITLARHYLDLGAIFVAVGTDVTVLSKGLDTLVKTFLTHHRQGLSSPPVSDVY